MANTFGIKTITPKRRLPLDLLLKLGTRLVPMGNTMIAAVEPVTGRPVDGELFYIRYRGESMFRRLTRVEDRLMIVSRSSRVELDPDEAASLEIRGRVALVFQFPNEMTEEQTEILNSHNLAEY